MDARLVRVALLAATAVLAVACTRSLDPGQLETKLKTRFERELNAKDLTVKCPDSEPAKAGVTFTCTATNPAGISATIMVTETDDQGNVKVSLTAAHVPSATPSP